MQCICYCCVYQINKHLIKKNSKWYISTDISNINQNSLAVLIMFEVIERVFGTKEFENHCSGELNMKDSRYEDTSNNRKQR